LSPAEINAMGLIDEILHLVVYKYQIERNPDAFKNALDFLNNQIDKYEIFNTLKTFCEIFPPLPVYKGKKSIDQYLNDKTEGVPNLLITLQELLMVELANENPAFEPYKKIFDDEELKNQTVYQRIILYLEEFFKTQPGYGPYNQPLIELLRSPMRASPNSLVGQLMYIKEHWKTILPKELLEGLLRRILTSLDFIREEKKERPPGPGPALVPEFKTGNELYQELHSDEPRFSPDTDWMPRVVMIAKHTYVWLYQLSKKYNKNINRLDAIPEEELKILSDWGFNAIWLIGIWERSKASARIKRLCGNPEALASAYSIYDYVVAQDLGGEEAFNNLKTKAGKYNIKIAVDMVPNHTAIDSKWIKEHPDWFIQRDTSPFFNYRFNGPNLSEDPDIEIYIEDGYYDRTDAAVVFKLVEKKTNKVRYIYHGNDGTSTPWNDTAQLNFLLPEVREAVIKKIIEIAKKSPIIRLDAAMILTKRHYHRLWFPEPGKGGDIPSRSEYSMTNSQFNKLFPKEFWREVVDRMAIEAPDTLLLAEAFWLMEGYFVRNLGMHRVYNSAFMNMLKMEQNKEYHQVLKNILDYNPEILKRFVNFMSNPDELPAAQQFGKDDKYFGVCIMMVTMPGLCMFNHGQIEGFQEKYGMEYQRSYWDEKVDDYLVKRHEREIFPLLKKRHLFSGIENFRVYDFYEGNGIINEDVFAYSNGSKDERILVVYNNRYREAKGWVRGSKRFHTENLCLDLGLRCGERIYYLSREHKSNLYYLINPLDIFKNGWYLELGAYKYMVFMDFKEIIDNQTQDYKMLYEFLNGSGFLNIELALSGMKMLKRIERLKVEPCIKEIIKPTNPFYPQIEMIIKNPSETKNLILYTKIPEIVENGYALLMNGIELSEFFKSKDVQDFLMVHKYDGIEWFNKERMELLLAWIFIDTLSHLLEQRRELNLEIINDYLSKVVCILELSVSSGYRYQEFLNLLTEAKN